jgi:hypothetical protein
MSSLMLCDELTCSSLSLSSLACCSVNCLVSLVYPTHGTFRPPGLSLSSLLLSCCCFESSLHLPLAGLSDRDQKILLSVKKRAHYLDKGISLWYVPHCLRLLFVFSVQSCFFFKS